MKINLDEVVQRIVGHAADRDIDVQQLPDRAGYGVRIGPFKMFMSYEAASLGPPFFPSLEGWTREVEELSTDEGEYCCTYRKGDMIMCNRPKPDRSWGREITVGISPEGDAFAIRGRFLSLGDAALFIEALAAKETTDAL